MKIELLYKPAISLLGTHLKDLKAGSQGDFCTTMLITALCTVVKTWEQLKWWMDKQNVVYTYNGLLALKRERISTHCDINGPCYAKWNEPVTKRHKLILLIGAI